MTPSISAIIIAKNESNMIANCIETLRWCDEIIVVNNDSGDNTVGIAHRLGARVVTVSGSFAEIRNEGLKRAKTDWVLYIDADERVTPALAAEIRQVITLPAHPSYAVNRKNVLYGQLMEHGGWEKDEVVRLFERRSLQGWAGEIHEHAEVKGTQGQLQEALWHLTHRSFIDGLHKSAEWTPIEAQLIVEAKVPKVTLLTLIRKAVMEIIRRALFNKGYQDGMAGWVEALVQGMNRLMVYIQVWEQQQKPSLTKKYQQVEESIAASWEKYHAQAK